MAGDLDKDLTRASQQAPAGPAQALPSRPTSDDPNRLENTTNTKRPSYIGRFAPSPSGPLHFGSLIAAVASYLDARQHEGQWLLRIDDIDPLREVSGASEDILLTLRNMGLEWDQSVIYQSQRVERYRDARDQLIAQAQAFYCDCSRKMLTAHNGIYPGNCRHKTHQPAGDPSDQRYAVRAKIPTDAVTLLDQLQGDLEYDLQRQLGDFVIWRKEDYPAYHLACAVDDGELGITHVVRGADLLDASAAQKHLQQQLRLNTPRFAHFPVAIQGEQKLSKRHQAKAIQGQDPIVLLDHAFTFLTLPKATGQVKRNIDSMLAWGVRHWPLLSRSPLHGCREKVIDKAMTASIQ